MPVKRGQGRTPDTVPHPLFAPPFEPPPDRRRRAIITRQILPAAAGNENVEDALNRSAVVGAWPSSVRWWRQHPVNERPLAIRQLNPAHMSRLIHLASASE